MTQYLMDIWKCRYFWINLVKSDLRTRYRRSVLGIGWSMLHPILMTAVLCTVFSTLFKLPIKELAPFILCGLTFWAFITSCTMMGSNCFHQGETYIRQYPAPMAIYPLRVVLGAAFHFALALLVAISASWILNGVGNIGSLVNLLPATLMLLSLGWSIAVLAGFSNVFFPDAHHLFEVGLQILFYMTPIMYKAEIMRERGMGWLVDYNPLNAFLTILHGAILRGHHVTGWAYGMAAIFTAVAISLAVTMLTRCQRRLIFHL